MLLLVVSILSLTAAAGFAGLSWCLVRDERRRSAARVAALGSAALDDTATDVRVAEPVPGAASLFDKRPAMRGHPLVRVAVVFAMVIALIVAIAMSANRHDSRQDVATSSAASAAAAAPQEQLELLSMRPERTGDALIVTGLVRNAGRAPARGLTAVVFAFDRGGNFVASGRAPIEFVTLGSGDDSPFRVTVPQVGDIGRYRVSFRNDAGLVRHIDKRPSLQANAQ